MTELDILTSPTVITMTEVPATATSQRSSNRGRGWRGGRFRRGRQHEPRRSGPPAGASQPVPPSQTEQPARQEPAASSREPDNAAIGAREVTPRLEPQPERGGGGRGRRGGGRRGTGQRSIVVSHRGGRGPPAVPGSGGAGSPGTGLSAAAPEFVPGQPVPISDSK